MNIGIIGSGDVARMLASGLHRHGHAVALGTRDTARLGAWHAAHAGIRVGSAEAAVQDAELVILAVKGAAAVEALAGVAPWLAGRTVIDTTNPLADAPPERGVLRYFTSLHESLLERLQLAYPAVHFVKAFNQVGHADMVDPSFSGGRPTMFICGNHAPAKAQVSALLREVGWDPEDCGGVEAARAIEPLCMLWCLRGFREGQWHHAFKLLK